jgi:hypothetical protein
VFTLVKESQEYCVYCSRYVRTRKVTTNHLVHLVISLGCAPWVFVWLLAALVAGFHPYRCHRCGYLLGSGATFFRAILFPLIGVVVFLTALVVGVIVYSGRWTRTTQPPAPEPPPPEVAPPEPDPPPVQVVGRVAGPPPARPAAEPEPGPMPREVRSAGPEPAPRPPPQPPGPDTIDGRTVAERQAIYRKVTAALAKVETDAVKKFGRKPDKDDPVSLSLPYKVFVEAGRDKVYSDLFLSDAVRRDQAEAILAEGDARKWAK